MQMIWQKLLELIRSHLLHKYMFGFGATATRLTLFLSVFVEEHPFPLPHTHCLPHLFACNWIRCQCECECVGICMCACIISIRQVLCHFVCVQTHDYKLLITLAIPHCHRSPRLLRLFHFCMKITQPVHIQYSALLIHLSVTQKTLISNSDCTMYCSAAVLLSLLQKQ